MPAITISVDSTPTVDLRVTNCETLVALQFSFCQGYHPHPWPTNAQNAILLQQLCTVVGGITPLLHAVKTASSLPQRLIWISFRGTLFCYDAIPSEVTKYSESRRRNSTFFIDRTILTSSLLFFFEKENWGAPPICLPV